MKGSKELERNMKDLLSLLLHGAISSTEVDQSMKHASVYGFASHDNQRQAVGSETGL